MALVLDQPMSQNLKGTRHRKAGFDEDSHGHHESAAIRRSGLPACAVASPLHAQWLKQPTPGIPRTPSGQPNLSAPAPRAADGKPDLSGVWGFDAGAQLFYIAGGLKPEEIRRAALEAVQRQADNFGRDDQFVRCLPDGPRFNHFLAFPKKIVQTPALIVVLAEDLSYVEIFLDGRSLPVDPSPSFMGYSVGRWDGNTLVVETTGYKDATKLDMAGNPHTENLRLTERYAGSTSGTSRSRRRSWNMKLYARPLTVTVKATLVPDTDLLEYVCTENERDRSGQRLIGTATEARKAIVPVTSRPAFLVNMSARTTPVAGKPDSAVVVVGQSGERSALSPGRAADAGLGHAVCLGRRQSARVRERRARARYALRHDLGRGRLHRETSRRRKVTEAGPLPYRLIAPAGPGGPGPCTPSAATRCRLRCGTPCACR